MENRLSCLSSILRMIQAGFSYLALGGDGGEDDSIIARYTVEMMVMIFAQGLAGPSRPMVSRFGAGVLAGNKHGKYS